MVSAGFSPLRKLKMLKSRPAEGLLFLFEIIDIYKLEESVFIVGFWNSRVF